MKNIMIRPISLLAVTLSGFAAVLIGAQVAGAEAPTDGAPAAELQILKTFQVGGSGGWDYPTIDPAAHRLYIARGTRVMVLDAELGTLLGEVADLQGAHGVALVPDRSLGFATSGRENTIAVFDLTTLKVLRKIKSGQNPDAILYDPASQKIFAFCGRSGDATIIDPANLDQAPVSMPLGGKLEAGVADGAGHVYVNDESKSEIVALDSKQQKVLAHWPLAPAERPTGLALDSQHHRLFSGCGNKIMAILDSDSGKLLATVSIGSGVDGVAFDPQLGALSANGRDGTLSVVREGPAGQFKVVQTLKTFNSARTITNDRKTHQAFLPATVPGENGANQFGVVVVGLPSERK